ncbi:hypothetical protein [Fontivita pretiosa]|uniref:hypothetical protein n=1 Tax=Fontivita pretiosa TaxID=2989684 RepID=UPI003D16C7A4
MSILRRQLEQARDEYRESRYPGDLAADVLAPATPAAPAPSGLGRWFWTIATMTAAAALVLVIYYYVANPSTRPMQIANHLVSDPIDQSDQADRMIEVNWSDVPGLSFAELPGELSLLPPSQSLSFAPATISFLTDTTESEQDQPSTTQEAV